MIYRLPKIERSELMRLRKIEPIKAKDKKLRVLLMPGYRQIA